MISTVIPGVDMVNPVKIIVPQLFNIGNLFKICYVQPDPLPSHIAMLQTLHVQGLEFVKIPINLKEDRLYIKTEIVRLLKVTNIQHNYIDECITNYNKDQTLDNRSHLLTLISFALDFYNYNNTEFLIQPI